MENKKALISEYIEITEGDIVVDRIPFSFAFREKPKIKIVFQKKVKVSIGAEDMEGLINL